MPESCTSHRTVPIAGAGRTRPDANEASLGGFQRIPGQIGEHLAHASPVAGHPTGKDLVCLDAEFQTFVAGHGSNHGRHFGHGLPDAERLPPDLHAAGLDLRQVEDVVHQAAERQPGGA
jgi:hypothetical protein